MFTRSDNRVPDALRPVEIIRRYTCHAPGSVLVAFGDTRVLVTATVEERVPRHIHQLKDENLGWLTAEYGMLPGATNTRTARERMKISGRTAEIQRLIGRTLRASIDLTKLGSRTITIDADVLQADGGTRVAAITGGYVAMVDALRWLQQQELLTELPHTTPIAAISAGVVEGTSLLDLNYAEDGMADVDANFVMDANGDIIELQLTSEKMPLRRSQADELIELAESGVRRLLLLQEQALAEVLPV